MASSAGQFSQPSGMTIIQTHTFLNCMLIYMWIKISPKALPDECVSNPLHLHSQIGNIHPIKNRSISPGHQPFSSIHTSPQKYTRVYLSLSHIFSENRDTTLKMISTHCAATRCDAIFPEWFSPKR